MRNKGLISLIALTMAGNGAIIAASELSKYVSKTISSSEMKKVEIIGKFDRDEDEVEKYIIKLQHPKRNGIYCLGEVNSNEVICKDNINFTHPKHIRYYDVNNNLYFFQKNSFVRITRDSTSNLPWIYFKTEGTTGNYAFLYDGTSENPPKIPSTIESFWDCWFKQ
jgi:hypothetical protein